MDINHPSPRLKRYKLMRIDQDKIDETVLAVLLLTLHDERRVWKNISWDVLDNLQTKGYIFNSKNKSKSIMLSEKGLKKAEEVFEKLFKSGDLITGV